MKNKQLKRALELQELIEKTSRVLVSLKALKEKSIKNPAIAGKNYEGKPDKLYNLCIAEYLTNSEGNLSRYEGNDEILDAVISILEKQLKAFETEFENL